MNRREFLTSVGGATAVSIIRPHLSFAADTTSLYVKGLMIVDFADPEFLRIGFPKAPGHKAILTVLAATGEQRTIPIKGHGMIYTSGAPMAGEARIFVPELVRMREIYGPGVKSRVDRCPSVISIPTAAIRAVETAELTQSRYSFERVDDHQEITTFRPRRVAESIRIDLSSAATLKMDNGKTSVALQTTRELRMEYDAPQRAAGLDAYADHFHRYFSYMERPAALDFDVIPKKLDGNNNPTPKAGHHFAMIDFWPYCFLIALP